MRVKLTTDLTQYDSRLLNGSEGETGEPLSAWGRSSGFHVGVYFDSGAKLDIGWSSLEIIDAEYLRQQALTEQQQVSTAANVIHYTGPRGGFKELAFDYTRHTDDGADRLTREVIGDRKHGQHLLELFRQHGVPVEVKLGH
ncbi:MAG TPA: hypothetical protein VKB24_09940 [Candidatus Acidoferrum sp.]|nr:hypothetical protein [Candidatus Acidoferrum sp.]